MVYSINFHKLDPGQEIPAFREPSSESLSSEAATAWFQTV